MFIDKSKNGKYVSEDGTEMWYKDGLLHREDGPALIYDHGTMKWYRNGFLHREDGPAIIWNNSDEEYFINNDELTVDEFIKWQLKNNKHPLQEINQCSKSKKIKV